MYPRLEGTNKCESCYSVVRHFLKQDWSEQMIREILKKYNKLNE
jgi:predicted ABC-class ATPase